MGAPVTIHAAKTHLSALVARAEAGEEIIIARGDKPVAKLVPLTPLPAGAPVKRRRFGVLRHLGSVGDEALDDWTEEDFAAWEQGHPGDPLNWR